MEVLSNTCRDNTIPGDALQTRANSEIEAYLRGRVSEYDRLSALRQQGWETPAGDKFFRKQKADADRCDGKTAMIFYRMMKEIAVQVQRSTGVLRIAKPADGSATILDFCMAPGGFLATSLRLNPAHEAVAFSLPSSIGGHSVLLPSNAAVTLKFIDITMLAADMGVAEIPPEHPDAQHFLPRMLEPEKVFELILCDGQVLRTHERALYRERREARRLTLTQLTLGLQHVSPGGTMVVLLHKVEAFETVALLSTFSKFSSIQLFKPSKYHAKRSSFYLIASNIQPSHPAAVHAIRSWTTMWKVATFGSDEDLQEEVRRSELGVSTMLRDFGPDLVRLGQDIWKIQADALEKAPWMSKRQSQSVHGM